MPTIEQIRAARALLDWSQSDLADHAGLSQTGIARIENGTNKPNTNTLEKITAAFDSAEIEFIGTRGVQKASNDVRIFKGHEGFIEFLNDVYSVVKNGQTTVVVNNVSEDLFLRWEGEEFAHIHQSRMEEQNVKYKIVVQEGDKNFTASKYAEYRAVPKEAFSTISFYIYGNRAALIDFSAEKVVVYVIRNQAVSDFYREEFNKIWFNTKAI